jgi:hypothetical protein
MATQHITVEHGQVVASSPGVTSGKADPPHGIVQHLGPVFVKWSGRQEVHLVPPRPA